MNSLEELLAWQKAREVRKKISLLSKSFPDKEKYKLKDQIIRSSRSVSANIAEGYGRFYFKENILFCRRARGSLIETLDHLYCALDEEYINEEQFSEYKNLIMENTRIINGYLRYLNKAKHEDILSK